MSSVCFGAEVRMKDIGKIIEERDNQLVGFGLVVGLRNTGDTKNSLFTSKALTNMLQKVGIAADPNKLFAARNVAAVMVTADLPPFTKPGQRIPCTVSAMGDCSSLVGGTLVLTELLGADMKPYATAQGNVVVGGVSGMSRQTTYLQNQTTVGRMPEGAIVEVEVPVTMSDRHHLTIVLDRPNFTTASRAAKALAKSGFRAAKAVDANTIKIPLQNINAANIVDLIAKIENVSVNPDASAKVVINSRTGTIVIGERVRLNPAAVTHGNVSVKITNDVQDDFSYLSANTAQPGVEVSEGENKLIHLRPQATLSSLVQSLNEIGATPKDLIAIIQALQESGSLIAEVEIL